MDGTWSLDALYKGYDDPALKEDLTRFETLIEKINEFSQTLDQNKPLQTLQKAVDYLERYQLLNRKLSAFGSLNQSANTTDPESTAYLGKLRQKMSESAKARSVIESFIASIEDLPALLEQDETLKDYSFYLSQIQSEGKYRLSDEVEEVIAKLNLSAGAAWSNMQQYLTSTVVVDYKGEKTNLSAIRNLAYDADQKVRKEAYFAELACYDKIKDGVAFSLNNLKSQINTLVDMRGYPSPLEMTLRQSRMKRETLEAMFTAMRESFPKFRAYLKRKGELLGHPNGLPFYDLFAPMGNDSRTYTVEEAKDYLVSHFEGFAPDLAEMVKRAFEERWIDFYPRAGKVGGAFCSNLPFIGQSRVLTNFDGSFSDIVTLAHELGHAYHGQQIQDHRPLNTSYSMPVAETASNFNETIIMSAAIEEASGDQKLALIESQISDVTQIIVDIYSRFLFESAVFEQRKDRFLFPDELCEIMLDAQKQSYGDGLDPDYLHPYMWVCKSHYYRDNLSFYNFPYAFGGLFTRGLYAIYQKEGEAFLPKYRKLLKETTVNTVEGVAASVGIDLSHPDFFRNSLKTVTDSIDLFLKLTEK